VQEWAAQAMDMANLDTKDLYEPHDISGAWL
jgi:hypothetical protein